MPIVLHLLRKSDTLFWIRDLKAATQDPNLTMLSTDPLYPLDGLFPRAHATPLPPDP
jgi:hypothetical protein